MALFCSSLNVSAAAFRSHQTWILVVAEAGESGARAAIGFFRSEDEALGVMRVAAEDLDAEVAERTTASQPGELEASGFYVDEGLIDLNFAAELVKACVFDLSLGLTVETVLAETAAAWTGPRYRRDAAPPAADADDGMATAKALTHGPRQKPSVTAEVAKAAPLARSEVAVKGAKAGYLFRDSGRVPFDRTSALATKLRFEAARSR